MLHTYSTCTWPPCGAKLDELSVLSVLVFGSAIGISKKKINENSDQTCSIMHGQNYRAINMESSQKATEPLCWSILKVKMSQNPLKSSHI